MSATDYVCDAFTLKQLFFDQLLCGAAQKLSVADFEARSAGYDFDYRRTAPTQLRDHLSDASPAFCVAHNNVLRINVTPPRPIHPLGL